jgi:adenosine deaminase
MEDQIKSQIELNTYCFSIPKIDLHAHLNGSIRKTTLFELSKPEDQEKLSELYSKQITLHSAFEIFKISSKILRGLDIVARITKEMIEDWNKYNTIYLEIRTTLKSINNMTKSDYLATVLSEIEKGNNKFTMQTRLIISLNRELPISDYLDTFETYKNFPDENLKKLVVGVDYCGN